MPTNRAHRESPNGFESAARLLKAMAIADYMETHARRSTGFDPERPEHWGALIKTVEGTSQEDWRRLSILAGQRPASEKTQAEVLSVLRGRASAHAGSIESLFARLGRAR